jgi:hypothetical protein
MKKLNKFVYIKDEKLVYRCGKYNVPKNLPMGEYYIWGEDVCYGYIRETYDYNFYNDYERYAVFINKDKVNLEKGMMTPIENIGYIKENTEILYPNHVYRTEFEIPTGFYLFKYDDKYFEKESFLEMYECGIDLYKANSDSGHNRVKGEYGCVEITNENRHIKVLNGIAKYFGKNKFDEIKIIEEDSVLSNEFDSNGKSLFFNEIIDLRLFEKHNKKSGFCGKVIIDVYCYEWYSINGKCKWRAIIKQHLAEDIFSLQLAFATKEGDRYLKIFDKFEELRPIYNDEDYKGCHVLTTDLPPNFYGKEIEITLLSINNIVAEEKIQDNLDLLLDKALLEQRKYYEPDFIRLKKILKEFNDLNLNVDGEIKFFDQSPEIAGKIIPILEELLEGRKKDL